MELIPPQSPCSVSEHPIQHHTFSQENSRLSTVMDTKDESPARGLKSMLSKSRRSRDESTILANDRGSPVRESGDSVLSKLKARMGSTEDDDLSENKVAKLIPGLGKRKEKKRRKAQEVTGSLEELRGRSGKASTASSFGNSESLSTLDESLMTSESEEEEKA